MASVTTSHGETRIGSQVATACAVVAAAIGVTVILGWNLGSESLIAVRPRYTAVQYNTSVALLCSSVALLALVCRRRCLATIAAGLVFLLAGATAVEYLAVMDLSIDTAFFNALAGRHVPGRMAPNTVTAFLCVAVAMLLLAWRTSWKRGVEVAASLCAFVGAVGAVAFTGYLANIPSAYEWSPRRPIAAMTTVAFLLLATGVIASAWHGTGEERRRAPRWLPAPLFVLLMSLCGMIAKSMWHTSRVAILTEARHSLVFSTVLVLVFGVAVSSALLAVMKLAQGAVVRSHDLQMANQAQRVAEAELKRLNRALQLVSACSEAIVHAGGEDELLQKICDLAVSTGGYRLAWVGFNVEDAVRTVRIAAQAGEAAGYVTQGFVTWADEPRGRGPTGTAIRTGKVARCDDVLSDASFLPWRERALQFGFRSSLAMPLMRQGRPFGVCALYAAEPNAFHDQEQALFRQLVEDLAFGIETIRTRAARARSEAALAASEERYRSLAVATAQVIWMTDPSGLVVGDMPTWREFTGVTVEQMQGWGWLDSLHPEDRESTARIWSDAVERRALYETEYRLRRADGEYRHVWVRGVPVLTAEGNIREWVGTCTDITERRHAEDQVRRNAHYARSLLESSLDPLVTISEEGSIMDVNRATEEVTGVSRQHLIGSDFCDYFTEPEQARQGYRRVFADGSVRDYPLAIRSRAAAGVVTDVLYNATLFKDQEGRVRGVFAAARDITERKRAQQELERYTEELKRSNTELQEFAFVASHDLQEPLRKITAFAERLREHSLAQLDNTSQDYLARMDSAAVRMSRLIESLLEYSRVTSRALPFEPVDLSAIVLGVISDLEQRIRDTGARITVETLPLLHGDPTQLRQLFQNLIGNALKFHAPSSAPRISIRATVAQPRQSPRRPETVRRGDSAAASGRCEVSVSDNGIGFDPAFADRIFRPFQRLHGRNEFEGSGMGLAICRKIAQRHGATITVHTAPGKGTTFTVSFPPTSGHPGQPNSGLPANPDERTDSCQETPYASCSPRMMTTTTC